MRSWSRAASRSIVACQGREEKLMLTETHASADWLDLARELQPETIELRRAIHREPELGLDLPETKAKLMAALAPLGLELRESRKTSGIVALLDTGRPGPVVLLRGDMDALPMSEATELDFKS